MAEDVIDAETGVSSTERRTVGAITVREQRALETFGGGSQFPLAELSDSDFSGLLDRMKSHYNRMKDVQRSLMKAGVHYGIPGKTAEQVEAAVKGDNTKVGLYKPGMEVLLKLHRYVADVKQVIHYGDPNNVTSPAIRVDSLAYIHADSLDGPVIAVGVGSCNSWETKYRYRNAAKKCPVCGQSTLKYQKEAKGGQFKGSPAFWCAPNRDGSAGGGCGAEFSGSDPKITSQEAGKVANSEAHDLENTLVKMSAKRARVDGTITATGASDLFTQDIEDMPASTRAIVVPEAEVESTLSGMYGAGNEDPDAWRKEVDATATKPATPVPPAQNAPPAKPGEDMASQSQRNLIGIRLKAKFGATNTATQESVLANQLGFPGGIASITKSQAGQLITKLNGMPDHVAGVAAPAPTPAAATTDDAATREKYAAGIKYIANQLTTANPNHRILTVKDGLTYVTGSNELGALGITGEIQLDALTVEQMVTLGTYLRQQQQKAQAA